MANTTQTALHRPASLKLTLWLLDLLKAPKSKAITNPTKTEKQIKNIVSFEKIIKRKF
jgi:hypothetical protein